MFVFPFPHPSSMNKLECFVVVLPHLLYLEMTKWLKTIFHQKHRVLEAVWKWERNIPTLFFICNFPWNSIVGLISLRLQKQDIMPRKSLPCLRGMMFIALLVWRIFYENALDGYEFKLILSWCWITHKTHTTQHLKLYGPQKKYLLGKSLKILQRSLCCTTFSGSLLIK